MPYIARITLGKYMNIWCISKYASPPKYGVAARIFYLAKEFVKKENPTILITSDSNHLASYPDTEKPYNYENIDGIELIWTKNKKYKKTASMARIWSWLDFELSLFRMDRRKLFNPDIIIVSSLSLLSIVYGYYLKKKHNALLVLEVRDIWPLTLVAEGGFNRFHPLCIFLSIIEKFGYAKSDLIVGTMPRLDKHIKNILRYEKPFFCSPLGFDPEVMRERKMSDHRQLKTYFPKDKIIIGYAGSMGISNNLETFIRCIPAFVANDHIHFVLVGGGDLRARYESILSLQPNVTFAPKITPSQVPYFLDQCDVLYLSTHSSEVWEYGQSMNKVVEYMYAGKPVVASYSGYPSMLNEANSGIFVEPNDIELLKLALLQVTQMSNLERVEMGSRGKVWVENNRTYEKLAEEYLKLLDHLVEKRELRV